MWVDHGDVTVPVRGGGQPLRFRDVDGGRAQLGAIDDGSGIAVRRLEDVHLSQ
ncbi:MAG: hypothetical protein JF887_06280 [Candidatus Dormibacteraeota bacterium]|uniref:Uncharacterized protein n=1 Tax=Candidatus Amunia macphersoniae TaxID=3127014 RepID=A0A934N9G6_9BACT|nr:hypothetical protein [Candidatus Dormibacteraeota bacterium]